MTNFQFKILTLTLATSFSAAALDNPTAFNFDGVLLNDPGGTPMVGPVSTKFQVYDPSGNCLLFEETHPSVTPDSTTGAFSVKLGGGTRSSSSVDGGLAWKTIFSNKGTLRATSSTNCTSGYTPATTDGRKLRITVGATTLTPDFLIASTPFATSADTLQGYQPTDFLASSGGSLLGFLRLDSQNELRFADSANTNYVALKAPSTLASSTTYLLPTADGTSGQVLTTNGAGQLSWSTASGGGLSLSGGTMTGAINMGGNNLTATGHITMSPQTTINLGTYTTGQESTMTAGLTAADKGKTWFNSTTNQLMYYDGTSAKSVMRDVGDITSATGKYFSYMPNNVACASGEFLKWNSGSTRWECGTVTSGISNLTGDVVAAGPGTATATIVTNAITTAKIADDAVTSAKLNSTGVAINRLLMTDGITGSTVGYANTCALGETLKWSATGWACSTDLNTDSVISVAGKTGAVTLDVGDIASGTGKYFTYLPNNTACTNGDLMQWNGGSTRWQCSTSTFLVHGGNAVGANLNIGSTDGFNLNLLSNGTSRMTIAPSGNVGVGTANPTAQFEVGATPTISVVARTLGATEHRILNSTLAPALKITNSFVGANAGASLDFVQYNSASAPKTAGEVSGYLSAIAAGSEQGVLTFATMTSATLTEKMRIDMAGNVGIGTTAPSAPLDVNGKAKINGDLALGNSAQTCAPAIEGSIRYNSTPQQVELCDGTAWKAIPLGTVSVYAGNYTDSAVSTSTTYYTMPMGPSTINGGTPSTTDYSGRTRNVVPRTGFLKNLYVKTSQDPASTWTYMLTKNGTDTGVTCNVTSGTTSCSDNVNVMSVTAGDEIGMKIITGSSGAANRSTWAFELASP